MRKDLFYLLSFIVSCAFLHGVSAYAQTPHSSFVENEQYKGAVEQSVVPMERPFIIQVLSQGDLKDLNTKIRNSIAKGEKNIRVELSAGTWIYDRLSIYLYNIDAPDVSVSIIGNGATLIAAGVDFKSGLLIGKANRHSVYFNNAGSLINLFEDVQQLDEAVEILDEKDKLCRVKLSTAVDYCDGMKIQLSQWYDSSVYDVLDIKNGYLYFVADNLMFDEAKHCYNVNYDIGVSLLYPRYRLFNPARLSNEKTSIHECTVSSFCCLYNVKFKSFSITNLVFKGCAAGKSAMIYFRNVKTEQVSIANCCFESINNQIVRLENTPNCVFKYNKVKSCSYGAVYSSMDCSNTIVRDNEFYRVCISWTNCSAVNCYGEDFLVSNNTFEDVGHSSISVGANSKWTNRRVSSGVIEGNHIWFGDDYYCNSYKYTLIDGGAIYVSTMNDRVVIKYNYIHNYSGIGSNRAVYCDDGAMNVKIYGNVIRGVTNGDAISSWLAKSMIKSVPGSNDGIDFYYNVIWGKYKLEERVGGSCIHGKNLILFDKQRPDNCLLNFRYQEEDSYYDGAIISDDAKIKLSRAAKRELRSFPTFNGLKKWIK